MIFFLPGTGQDTKFVNTTLMCSGILLQYFQSCDLLACLLLESDI